MKGSSPMLPIICLRRVCRSAVRESGVASSGKVLLYLCINLRARKRPWTNSGARQL